MGVTATNFDKALSKAYDTLSKENQVSTLLGALLDKIYVVANTVVLSLDDGIDFNDLPSFGVVTQDMLDIIEGVDGLSKEDQKKLLRDIFLVVYVALDRGVTGEENNINVPFAFGPIERKIELEVINLVSGALYTALSSTVGESTEAISNPEFKAEIELTN